MEPATVGAVACIAATSVVVTLSVVWWMIKSAMRMAMKLVVLAVLSTVGLGVVAAVAAAVLSR
jgi:hypothetical protein